VVAQFLQDNFTRFFDAFSALLQSNNYVTRRQSLKVSWGCIIFITMCVQ
jgi:hypothetical protein